MNLFDCVTPLHFFLNIFLTFCGVGVLCKILREVLKVSDPPHFIVQEIAFHRVMYHLLKYLIFVPAYEVSTVE